MDDVGNNMHEEEEQLQEYLDEQQMQEDTDDDEDVDEQVDISDDEEESDDDDWQGFEVACDRIAQNDTGFDSLVFRPTISLDDDRAIMLGRALLGNTVLNSLPVRFMDHTLFTAQGAQAFVGGILGSRIKYLPLWGEEELPIEMSHLCGRSLKKVYLHFPVGDDFVIQLCESLTVSKQLQSLHMRVDQMTHRGAKALANFIRNSPVKKLGFYGDLENDVVESTMQILFLEGIQHCPNIEKLYLEDLVCDMHGLVATLPKLCELAIKSDYLNLDEVELLTHGLSYADKLHTLVLEDCGLNNEHLSMLSSALGNHQSIKSLTLDFNDIGDADIASFVENWRPESVINQLVLSRNNFGPKGAHLIIDALSNRPTFCSLDLHTNFSIGLDGLKLIGEALSGATIQKLNLVQVVSWIEYKDVACNAAVIQEAKRVAASKALLEGVRGNKHLLQVELDGLRLPTTVVEEINLYITANALGRRAALEQSLALPSGVWSYFLAKERMTSSLVFLFLRELPGVLMGGSRSNTIGKKRCRVQHTSPMVDVN